MRRFPRGGSLLAVASAVLVSVAAFVPMIVSGHITRDSGVFAYTGMVVSRGGMPYVDSWDHKGPLLAAIETAAWQIGGGIVGAPILEGIVLAVGLGVSGVIWARWIGNGAAAVVLLTGVTYLAVFEGGNFTETWLFPFQLVAYSLAAHVALTRGREASARMAAAGGLVMGMALSVGLFTRMNNVAGLVVLVVAAAVLLRRRLVFVGAVVGVTAVIGVALALWLLTGDALRAALDQYVRYNLFYSSGAGGGDRLGSFATLSQALVSGAVVAGTLVLIGAWAVVRRRGSAESPHLPAIVALLLAVAGADALSQMASGRPYPHYLVVAVAGFAVLVAVLGSVVLPVVRAHLSRRAPLGRRLASATVIAAVLLLTVSSSTAGSLQSLRTIRGAGVFMAGSYQAQLAERVRAETSPDDRVLVHGAETWILASAERLSPTSITYSLPVEQGYGGLSAQYLADITSFPPALIVESPVSCGISIECPPDKAHFEGLAPWVASAYELEGDVVGFRFWRRIAP